MLQLSLELKIKTNQTTSLTERDRYQILSNPERHIERILPLAAVTVENTIWQTQSKPPFDYEENAFELWLKNQYEESSRLSREPHYLDSGLLPDGRQLSRFSDAAVAEFLLQKIPQNINDGTFLAQVGATGPCSSTETALMKIKYEEAGNGDVSENHANLFYHLVRHELGIKLPPLNNLSQDQRIIDSAFNDPVFQLAIAQFPKRYLPEILGMTVLLEWTGTLDAFRMAKVLRGRKINPKFYQAHILADNPKDGHAYQAKEAVKHYLEEIRKNQGKTAQQEHWHRIYQGWSTWKYIMEDFERNLVNHLVKFEGERAA